MSQLSRPQCELIEALGFRGHAHGIGELKPIIPDKGKSFKCSLAGEEVLLKSDELPLSDLIASGYIRIYDEDVGSLIFTQKAESEHDEIRDRYMQFLRHSV